MASSADMQRAFLPGRQIRGMLAREHDASVDGTERLVMRRARLLGPHAEASHRERRAVPGDGDAVVEFLRVLRMNLAAVFHGLRHSLLRRHGGELRGVESPEIPAEQHALAVAEIAAVRVADIADRQIGVGDAAVDLLVLFPEAALELQSDLDGRRVRDRGDGLRHGRAHLHRDLSENR